MAMNMGQTGLPTPHKPTLGYTVGIIIVVVLVYHFAFGKGKR